MAKGVAKWDREEDVHLEHHLRRMLDSFYNTFNIVVKRDFMNMYNNDNDWLKTCKAC